MNCCHVYPSFENWDEDAPNFSCGADGEFEKCNHSDGFKNRCPHKAGRDCTSKKANLEAAIRAKREMQSLIKSLKFAMAME